MGIVDYLEKLKKEDLEEIQKRRLEIIPDNEMPTERMWINFGPQHPATHGTLHLELLIDGETVIDVIPHIGYLHTGFEKLGEYHTYNQWITATDRMNYLSSFSNNLGWTMAVEKLFDIEVPKRGQYIRVIGAELSRIADHLVTIGTAAMDTGAMTVFLFAFREREKIYDLFDILAGARMTVSFSRVGGLLADMPDEFIPKCHKFIEELGKTLNDIEGLLNHNNIWLKRTKGIGYISPEKAVSYGLTGPILRAAGIEWDIRKAEPYCSYEDFDFEVVIGENSDVYDRYLVRVEEIRQSVRIVQQGLDNLPGGPINANVPEILLPEKSDVYNSMESLIYHFKMIMKGHGFRSGVGEVYQSTEAPNGELGFYVVSDGKGSAYRARVRPPSFLNFQAFPEMLIGGMLSDTVAILGSLNIIAGELDR